MQEGAIYCMYIPPASVISSFVNSVSSINCSRNSFNFTSICTSHSVFNKYFTNHCNALSSINKFRSHKFKSNVFKFSVIFNSNIVSDTRNMKLCCSSIDKNTFCTVLYHVS